MAIIRKLIDLGAEINHSIAHHAGRTELQGAAENGRAEAVDYFLSIGARVNAPPSKFKGVTALQGAASSGNVGIVRQLLLCAMYPSFKYFTLVFSMPVPANQTDNFPTYTIMVNDVSGASHSFRCFFLTEDLRADEANLGILRPSRKYTKQSLRCWYGLCRQLWRGWCSQLVHKL